VPAYSEAILAFTAAVEAGASPLDQQSLLFESVRLALRHGGERSLPPEPRDDARAAARARDYLHAHLFEPVTLEELARVSGASRFHLVRMFARAYGLPPHEYQNAVRVAKAQSVLRSGTRLVDVAVGFADQSHFSRHFKRVWAVTPGRYAAAFRRRGH
jgi:AraC-like DNA-binding protein